MSDRISSVAEHPPKWEVAGSTPVSGHQEFRHTLYDAPGRAYGWRARLAWFVLSVGCRHQVGIVCSHRQYLYDFQLRGFHSGYSSGIAYERSHQPRRMNDDTTTDTRTPEDV